MSQWHECGICHRTYIDEDCYERHVNKHLGTHPMRYYCSMCPATFLFYNKWAAYEKLHVPTVMFKKYREPKTNTCTICNKTFSTHLKMHMETHKNIKDRLTFQCELCDKIFLRQNSLRRHTKEKHST